MKNPTSWRNRFFWIVLSLLLIAPAIASNFMNDDYFFNSELHAIDTPFGYYDFLPSRDMPTVPWWAAEGFRVRFFRPLASLSLHLDFSFSKDNALLGHLHSAAWLVALLLGAFALFDRLLDNAARRWAMPLLSLGLFTAWAAGWISARHAIMGGTFSVWATVFFVDSVRNGGPVRYVLSLVLFGLGLLSSESTLAFAAVTFLLTMHNEEDWLVRVRFILPPILFGIAYMVFYKWAGFGSQNSDLYLSPLDTPVAYLASLPSKMLALFGSFTFGIPAMIRILPGAEPIAIVGGVLAVLVLTALTLLRWNSLDDNRQKNVRFLWAAVPVAMLPEMAGMVEGRGSLLAAVLFCALTAMLLQGAFAKNRSRRTILRIVAGIVFAGMLILSPLSRLGAGLFIYMGAANLANTGQDSKTGCKEGQAVYQINADSLMAVMSPFIVAYYQGAFFNGWHQLGQAPRDLTLTRIGTDTLRLEADDGVVASYLWLFRKPDTPWHPGKAVNKDTLQATVTRMSNGNPVAVDFYIDGLSTGRACLVRSDGFLLRHQPVPPVNEPIVIPWVPPM